MHQTIHWVADRFLRAALSLFLSVAGMTALSYSASGQISAAASPEAAAPLSGLFDQWFQVSIEQRVIIRIPRQSAPPANMGSRSKATPMRYKEEKIGKCLLVDKLIATRIGNEHGLDLITRDGAMIRAYLGDGCLASEFYAGAYTERPMDGKLCVDRDLLRARTGAKCEIDKFRLLVPQ